MEQLRFEKKQQKKVEYCKEEWYTYKDSVYEGEFETSKEYILDRCTP